MFSVGDMVRVYSYGAWRIGYVVNVEGELYVKFYNQSILGNINDSAVKL